MKKYFEFTQPGDTPTILRSTKEGKSMILLSEVRGFSLLEETELTGGGKTQTITSLKIYASFGEFYIGNVNVDEYERFEQAFKNWLDEKDSPARIREL